MNKKSLEELLIVLSLSNLLFITSWRRIIYPTTVGYHIKLEPDSLDYIGVILSVIIMTAVLLGGLKLFRLVFKEKFSIVPKMIFLGIFGVVLNGVRLQIFESDSGIYSKIALFAGLILIAVFALIKLRDKIFTYTRSLLLILSPFVVITFSQAVIGAITANPVTEPSIKSQLSAVQPSPQKSTKERLVWIIFDDLDYFVPFEMQPSIVGLPEFEKLKTESLTATNAKSPAYETLNSLPSLITGKIVEKSEPAGKNELILNYRDKTRTKFSETPNIFSKIKAMNGNTAIVGWYHSYCRVIGKDLSACQWESSDSFNDFEKQALPKVILKNFTDCLISLPFGYRLFQFVDLKFQTSPDNLGYMNRHYSMIEGTRAVIANPNIDMALIHLPFPHYPYLYDRNTGKFGSTNTYFDNLVLTDIVLKDIRQTMEQANLWDNSIVIVSSDHQWRINQYKSWLSSQELEVTKGIEGSRVPFFLKLKNQHESLTYDKPFNTVVTPGLILALMKGEVSTVEDVKTWLDNNSEP